MAPHLADQTLTPVFGVRHLSPSGAWHLRRFLDRARPKVVLIEGLADADGLIPDITRRQTAPPIAILAYTQSLPVRTLVYPLARYSPEYQALAWASENRAEARFIDLPSDIFLALEDARQRAALTPPGAGDNSAGDNSAGDNSAGDNSAGDNGAGDNSAGDSGVHGESEPGAAADDDDDAADDRPLNTERRVSLYERFAHEAGEPDYETYWERRFEHNLRDDSYRRAAFEFGRGLRELEQDDPRWRAENLVREAYMRRRVLETIASGVSPDKIVVVVGAFHAPVLTAEHPAMSDHELASLPRRPSKLTLMPYSYLKLSSQSGYGAGNHAPAYFQLLWDCLRRGDLAELPALYLSLVARQARDGGTHRSTAEVIEGVRLACTLSALKDGSAPTLRDLQDAAVTLIGHGERASIAETLARVEVGTEIGRLPEGVSKTSIQDDFRREVARLKLEKYLGAAKQDLALDLRENRSVKTEAAAWLDLNRSSFLHRLRILEIPFAAPAKSAQQAATWSEKWTLQWTPEAEISLVEAVLLGETVELAAAYKFKALLEKCARVDEAAALVRDACQCGLLGAMELARRRAQELSALSTEFVAAARAAGELSMIARYGDVRRFDPAPLLPLMGDLFVQGALALLAAARCDNEAARAAIAAVDELNKVSLEHHDRVDEELWLDRLKTLSDADDRNPLLSGYACAILLERGLLSSEELGREVSRRLSPGIAADLGAGWFEGVSKRNRHALLARQPLWRQLADYVRSLDEEQFRRAIVFLRRAFGCFSPREKQQITENLGEHWGVNAQLASEALHQPLSEHEQKSLDELNELSFDDL